MNEQLDLLTIRKQPMQPEPKIPSRTIKAYVKENLRDFAKRQALRERTRKEYQKAEKRQPSKKRTTEEHVFMKTIPITFRAVFEQPTGPLNPMGVKMAGAYPIEVFRRGPKWYARELSSPNRRTLEKLGYFDTLEGAKRGTGEAFTRKIADWQVWGVPPIASANPEYYKSVERVLLPDEFEILPDGKAGWYTAEDRTHIIDPPRIEGNPRIPPAACGVTVPAKCFVNNRANVRPSCKACAEIWEKDYKGK